MSAKPRISRRQFIQVSALAAAGTVAAACVPATATPPAAQPVSEGATPVQPAAAAAKYSEAPSLAALVAEGKLPPVEERLPVEPFVVGPGVLIPEEDLDWEVGEYSREGEVLRAVTTNPTWDYCCQHAQEHFLNTPPHHTGPVTGNILSSWSVNEDCTAYEFTLRK
ncbi:MAG: twin-arginine translocation signal domain-containing protein, partial [Chloroflexi bacterium]|nr:twin-arginine translocation signal domain-containing protein [Chloroflexota bacterium]